MHVTPELGEAPLLLAFDGWNDAGEAATTALRFIQDALRCVPLAEIDCEEFFDFTVRRPTVRIAEANTPIIEWPTVKFSYGTVDATREFVIGIGAEPHMRWRRYTKLICEFVKRIGATQVVMLGAYLADVVYSRPVSVTGYASTPALLEKLGVAPSHYEGPTGIIGVLAEELNQQGVEIVSLWAGLPHYISYTPDSRGALALLHAVTDTLDFKIDDEPLRRAAEEFESRISELVASDPELGEYVRELKRREFAQ